MDVYPIRVKIIHSLFDRCHAKCIMQECWLQRSCVGACQQGIRHLSDVLKAGSQNLRVGIVLVDHLAECPQWYHTSRYQDFPSGCNTGR